MQHFLVSSLLSVLLLAASSRRAASAVVDIYNRFPDPSGDFIINCDGVAAESMAFDQIDGRHDRLTLSGRDDETACQGELQHEGRTRHFNVFKGAEHVKNSTLELRGHGVYRRTSAGGRWQLFSKYWGVAPLPRFSLLAILLFSASCQWAASDTIDTINIFNKIPNTTGVVRIRCDNIGQNSETGKGSVDLEQVDEHESKLMLDGPDDSTSCFGQLQGKENVLTFDVYKWAEDHPRCKERCMLELREDGVYWKNQTTSDWQLYGHY